METELGEFLFFLEKISIKFEGNGKKENNKRKQHKENPSKIVDDVCVQYFFRFIFSVLNIANGKQIEKKLVFSSLCSSHPPKVFKLFVLCSFFDFNLFCNLCLIVSIFRIDFGIAHFVCVHYLYQILSQLFGLVNLSQFGFFIRQISLRSFLSHGFKSVLIWKFRLESRESVFSRRRNWNRFISAKIARNFFVLYCVWFHRITKLTRS